MSGVKRYEADVFATSCRFRDTVVLASDYAALEAESEQLRDLALDGANLSLEVIVERDELRAQVEAMRDLLRRFSDAYRNTCGSAYKLLPEVDAALQAKP